MMEYVMAEESVEAVESVENAEADAGMVETGKAAEGW